MEIVARMHHSVLEVPASIPRSGVSSMFSRNCSCQQRRSSFFLALIISGNRQPRAGSAARLAQVETWNSGQVCVLSASQSRLY